MAIDPNWVRDNPEEAARQIDLLQAHCTRLGQGGAERYWEGRYRDEAKINESLQEMFDALMGAKLEALPADLKSRVLIVKMTGDIELETVRKFTKQLRKHAAGCGVFLNMKVDMSALDMTSRDAEKKAEALEEAAKDTVPAMHQMANWLLARAAEERRKVKGGISE